MAKAHRPKPSQRKAEPPKPERIIAMTTLPLPRKAKPLFTWPTPEEAAEIAAQERRDYLAWAARAINARRLNRNCRSAHCRRNGCRDAERCEPRLRGVLTRLRLLLWIAVLDEQELRNCGPGRRRGLVAFARKRGLLPPDPSSGRPRESGDP